MEPSLKDTILKFSLRFREVKIKGTLGDALLYPGTGFGGKYLGTTVQNSSRVSFQDCVSHSGSTKASRSSVRRRSRRTQVCCAARSALLPSDMLFRRDSQNFPSLAVSLYCSLMNCPPSMDMLSDSVQFPTFNFGMFVSWKASCPGSKWPCRCFCWI